MCALQTEHPYCTRRKEQNQVELPKSCDPAAQELRREARWDNYLRSFPRCANCGEPILADTRFYFPKRDEFWCPDCIAYLEKPNDPLDSETEED